jgi:hypothetical protein
MIENNDISNKKGQSTRIGKDRPDLISQEGDIINLEKRDNLMQEEKIKSYKKNQKKVKRMQSRISMDLTDTVYNNKETIKDTFDIDEDFLNKNLCTAVTLGLEPMPQRCYICPICDIKKEHFMCNYCYLFCHEKCRLAEGKDSPKSKEENNFLGEKEFACYCGNILKHKIFKIHKVLLIPCSMVQLDEALGVKMFYCEVHQITICCVCAVKCHEKCHPIEYNERANEITICKCNTEYHSIYNEIAFRFSLDKYKKKKWG